MREQGQINTWRQIRPCANLCKMCGSHCVVTYCPHCKTATRKQQKQKAPPVRVSLSRLAPEMMRATPRSTPMRNDILSHLLFTVPPVCPGTSPKFSTPIFSRNNALSTFYFGRTHTVTNSKKKIEITRVVLLVRD